MRISVIFQCPDDLDPKQFVEWLKDECEAQTDEEPRMVSIVKAVADGQEVPLG
jgi:hypothetical protein